MCFETCIADIQGEREWKRWHITSCPFHWLRFQSHWREQSRVEVKPYFYEQLCGTLSTPICWGAQVTKLSWTQGGAFPLLNPGPSHSKEAPCPGISMLGNVISSGWRSPRALVRRGRGAQHSRGDRVFLLSTPKSTSQPPHSCWLDSYFPLGHTLPPPVSHLCHWLDRCSFWPKPSLSHSKGSISNPVDTISKINLVSDPFMPLPLLPALSQLPSSPAWKPAEPPVALLLPSSPEQKDVLR